MYKNKFKFSRLLGFVFLMGSILFYAVLPGMVGWALTLTTENLTDDRKDLNELRNWILIAVGISFLCEFFQSCIFKIIGKQISE